MAMGSRYFQEPGVNADPFLPLGVKGDKGSGCGNVLVRVAKQRLYAEEI